MPKSPRKLPTVRRIEIVAFPDMTALDLTGRVEAARQMLSTGHLSVKSIARRCGFGSEETMRRSFLRQIGVTPHDYRLRFQPVGAAPPALQRSAGHSELLR